MEGVVSHVDVKVPEDGYVPFSLWDVILQFLKGSHQVAVWWYICADKDVIAHLNRYELNIFSAGSAEKFVICSFLD